MSSTNGSDFDPAAGMTVAGASNPLVPPTRLHAYRPVPDMLADYQAVPLASGLVFPWCVSDASYDLEPKIIKAQFGDGYAQRRPAGINTQAHMWSVSMKNIDGTSAKDVTAWLAARNGVDIFSWTPPRTATALNVLCPSWSMAYGDLIANGTRLFTVNFKLEEVFF